jgi:uncharacterized membrane protein YkvA (DUF1232 family)
MRLTGTVARVPRYLVLAGSLIRDPAIPLRRKAALGAAIGYAVSPIDLVPGVIPVAGQLDDVAALLLGLRQATRACPPDRLERHLATAGLSSTALDADLKHVRGATEWILATSATAVRQGAEAALGAASVGLRTGTRVARRGWARLRNAGAGT